MGAVESAGSLPGYFSTTHVNTSMFAETTPTASTAPLPIQVGSVSTLVAEPSWRISSLEKGTQEMRGGGIGGEMGLGAARSDPVEMDSTTGASTNAIAAVSSAVERSIGIKPAGPSPRHF